MRHADCCPRFHRPALAEGSAQVHRPLVRRRPAPAACMPIDPNANTAIDSYVDASRGSLRPDPHLSSFCPARWPQYTLSLHTIKHTPPAPRGRAESRERADKTHARAQHTAPQPQGQLGRASKQKDGLYKTKE